MCSLLYFFGCKGTKKNVYVQEKFTFIVIGYIFECSFGGMPIGQAASEGTKKNVEKQENE